MAKVVVLDRDTIIDGKFYRQGEVVQVDDGFSENIKEVIKENIDNGPTEQVS